VFYWEIKWDVVDANIIVMSPVSK